MKIKLLSCITFLYLLLFTNLTFGQELNLGTIQNFLAYTAGGAVSNTNAAGNSNFIGDLGSFTGSISGFGTPYNGGKIVSGDFGNTFYDEALARQAKKDLLNVYIHLCDIPITNFAHSPAFGSETLFPGAYLIQGTGNVAGNLILDGGGDSNAMFIIRFNGAFTANAGSKIILTGGATAKNIFWIAEGVISIEAGSIIKGTLLSHPGSITIADSAVVEGRLLSTEGAISFIGGKSSIPEGVITVPISCTEFCGNPMMGTAANFILFSGDGSVSSGGTSSLIGDIGTNGGAVTNLAGATVIGNVYSEPNLITAKALEDLNNACSQLIAITEPAKAHAAVFGNGETLEPGVYSIAGAGSLAGNLTLDGKGDPDALFIFKFAGAFSTGSQSRVILVNGVRSCNIFWVATGGAVSLGTFTHMKGNLIANPGANSAGANSNLEGGMYSTAGAVSYSTGVNYKYSHCNDSTPPTITTGANQAANTDSGICTASVVVTDATFKDNYPGATITYTLTGATTKTLTAGQVGTYTFNKGVTTINYTVTDAASNTITGSKTITVNDITAPTITAGADQTANTDTGVCTASVLVTDATFGDNCTGSTIAYTLTGATTKTLTAGQVGTYTFNKGITTINYTVSDAAANTTLGTKTITVTDITAPTITAGANQTANTNSGVCTASVLVTDATFGDNCSGSTIAYTLSGVTTKTLTAGQVGTYTFNKGVTTINYTVTDAALNSITGSKTITVSDITAPTITAGANQTANTNSGVCTASVIVTDATFGDNCSGSTIAYTLSGVTTKTLTSGQVGTYTFNKGVTTINYTVTDADLNSITGSKTITVSDITAPTITAGANQTANTNSGVCTASVLVTDATFGDNCSGSTIAYTLSGVTTKTLTAGQVGTYTFNKGVTTINYSVTDAASNTITGSKTITVNDITAPTITAGANQTANTDSGVCTASVLVTDATFGDNCTGSTIAYTLTGATTKAFTAGQVGTYTFNKGITTINYSVTDTASNTITGSKTITVNDITAPTITAGANQTTNTDSGVCTASVLVTDATFGDNCAGSTIAYTLTGATTKTLTAGQVGTYTFNKGVTTINYTVTDTASNTITGSKTITVNDITAPTITAGVNQTANTDTGVCTASVIVTDATFGDNCTGSTIAYTLTGATIKTLTAGQVGTYTFNIGITTINYTVTDAASNTITGSKTITITDITAPTITSLPTISGNCSVTISIAPTSPDNCGTVTGVTSDITLPYTYSTTGVYIIGWNFTDASGNSKNISQTIIVTDTTAPVPNITNLPDINFTGCQLLSSQITYPKATDTCSGTITGVPDVLFPLSALGTTNVTWTYTDATGNISSQIQKIIMTSEVINGGTLKGYISVNGGGGTPTTEVSITSCSVGGNVIKMNLTGQTGTIVQWEKFVIGNPIWETIPNTTNAYTVTFYAATTESTYYRALIKVGTCYVYSSSFYVRALPADLPPILDQSTFNICLNQSVTLVSRRGYTVQEDAIAGKGGDFNQGQLNTQDPKSWLVDGNPGDFTAGGNSTKPRNWSGTNNHQFGSITYDSEDGKFAISSGNHTITSGSNKYTGANPAILESPIFSLANLTSASIDFDQAYYFATGDLAIIYISLNGGTTYSILKTMHAVGAAPLLWYTDTNVTAAQKVGATATQYNFKNDNTSIPLTSYLGQTNVRIKWAFRGTDDKSVWAMDNISIPVKPKLDQIEWTDGIGNPSVPALANGQLETSYTFVPQSPGKHKYGSTILVDGCRSYSESGTALADVNVNYSYAGSNITLTPDVCGSNTVQLNAYDNSKSADQNAIKGSYTKPTGCTNCDDPGTNSIGTWSITGTSACGTGTFSNINDPDATFTGEVGTYKLSWLVSGCASTVDVVISACNQINFDGVNDYVDFKKTNYDLNGNFSIEAWVKTTASSNSIQTIFSKRDANKIGIGNGYDLRVQNDYVSFIWNGTGIITSPNKIGSNRWYHIAVTYANSEYKLYIDGILIISKSGASAPITNTNLALIGAMDQNNNAPNNPVNHFNGWIDEFKIWNVALTEDQLHQMMNQRIREQTTGNNVVYGEVIPMPIYGLTWTNLKGYYRMDQISCGYLNPNFGVGANGKLKNITSSQSQTAPLPYESKANGEWTNRTSATPWLYGNTVWDYPNSTGINGSPIDWNIVKLSHNVNSGDKDITILGLISESGKLTIKDPVNTALLENNDGQNLWITHYLELKGSIDLVGESQLMQKKYNTAQISESILEASSSGFIKCDQQGKKNSYNYNYWSSPVSIQGGATNAPFSISNVLRDGTDSSNPKAISFGDGAYFADGILSNPIKISNRWIWSFNSQTPATETSLEIYNKWKYIGNTVLLKTGEGYTMKGTGGIATITDTQNYVFTGKPNNGTISLPLPVGQSYLIGNPYPSAINVNEFILDNLAGRAGVNVFNGALYFWDHFGLSNSHTLGEYQGGYSTLNLIGGVTAINNSPLTLNNKARGISAPKQFIPIGQAFFVNSKLDPSVSSLTTVSGGTLVFKNSQRSFAKETSGSSTFMKTSGNKKTKSIDTDIRPKIRLGFDSSIGTHRQILVGADPNATNDVDLGYDAPMNDKNGNDMYWAIIKNQFVIQGVPDFNADQIIPIGIVTTKAGDVVIKIDELENVPSNTNIYLYDGQTDIYQDLRNSDFKTKLEIGEYNERFSLKFEKSQNKSLAVVEKNSNFGITVFYSNKILNINNNELDTTVNSVSLYNILGQAIENWDFKNNEQTNIQIPIKNLSSAVYIAKIKTSNGEFSKKIIIN